MGLSVRNIKSECRVQARMTFLHRWVGFAVSQAGEPWLGPALTKWLLNAHHALVHHELILRHVLLCHGCHVNLKGDALSVTEHAVRYRNQCD